MQIIALDTTTPQLRAPPSGSTYSAPRAIVMTPETLTGSSATSSLSIAQTWNTTGTPTAIDLNVTDTASNASSLLMNLRVGGSSRFSVSKTGSLFLASSGSAEIRGLYNTGYITGGEWRVGNTLWIQRDSAIQWDSAGSPSSNTTDLVLRRDAANTLAQRNGVNAQAFNIYNTFTDASNYERGVMAWSSNTLIIGTQSAGTGSTSRNVSIAAQNGAITFTAGFNLCWQINTNSHFVAGVDNTFDIGLSGGSRPRRLYLGGGSLTGSQADSSLSITPTWNTTGTPTAIDLNVTDTASNAASLLLNLRRGGVSQFNITKFGEVTSANFVAASEFRSGNSYAISGDVIIRRDAANTLALRNGTNAQAFNVYNTFTDASNYERLAVSYVSNIARIETAQAGTGASRILLLRGDQLFLRSGASGNGVGWQVDASGHLMASSDNSVDIGAAAATRPRNVFIAGYHQMSEMTAPAAPAANGVRIYAEDNGSGKTRLMALFATGAAQQIAIEP